MVAFVLKLLGERTHLPMELKGKLYPNISTASGIPDHISCAILQ